VFSGSGATVPVAGRWLPATLRDDRAHAWKMLLDMSDMGIRDPKSGS